MTYNYESLEAEIASLPYGNLDVSDMSPELQRYVKERYARGLAELGGLETLKRNRQNWPQNVAPNGHTKLLGLWYFRRGKLDSAIRPNVVWMATLKNNPIIKL